MSDAMFEIKTPGVDAGKLVAEIRAAAEQKMAAGVYADARIARAERLNLANLRDADEFLNFYLKCLRDAAFVDISDFPIRERRAFAGPLLVALKKTIWGLLKFYTYRLWLADRAEADWVVHLVGGIRRRHRAARAGCSVRIGRCGGGDARGAAGVGEEALRVERFRLSVVGHQQNHQQR